MALSVCYSIQAAVPGPWQYQGTINRITPNVKKTCSVAQNNYEYYYLKIQKQFTLVSSPHSRLLNLHFQFQCQLKLCSEMLTTLCPQATCLSLANQLHRRLCRLYSTQYVQVLQICLPLAIPVSYHKPCVPHSYLEFAGFVLGGMKNVKIKVNIHLEKL